MARLGIARIFIKYKMMHQTSLQAYNEITPKLGYKQRMVYSAIAELKSPVSNAELANLLLWPINCVTPRVLELRKAGLVVYAGTRICQITGHTAMVWVKN